jgi:hypothetical protein
MVLGTSKNSRLLVTQHHQGVASSITNAFHQGSSRCRGVVHSAYTSLSSAFGLIIQDYVHLPRVALATQWGLLTNVEGLTMIV